MKKNMEWRNLREIHHHENNTSFQQKFEKDVDSMILAMEELGSPFEDEGNDLVLFGQQTHSGQLGM